MQTKTTTKAKAAPKSAPKAKPSAIVAAIVAGVTERLAMKGATFYANALKYHAKKGTKFPRSDAHKALSAEDVSKVFEMHDKGILAPGNAVGQALFDAYMMHRPK